MDWTRKVNPVKIVAPKRVKFLSYEQLVNDYEYEVEKSASDFKL
jgi:hypothetical protein